MSRRREILRTHYVGLAKKVATLVGVVALLGTALVPTGALAIGQLTTRSVTVGTSAGGAASTPYTIGFTLSASQTLGSVLIEICDSPLSTTSCAGTVGSSGASLGSATFGSMSLGSGWSIGSQTGASSSGTNACVTHTAATLSGAASLVLNAVHNPTATNTEYYVRISTFQSTTCTTQNDFGAVALSTTQSLTVEANVQESLTFCTGTAVTPANCGAESGSTVNIGTGADNVLSASAPSGAISTMVADTNAGTGYSITYFAANLSSSSDTIGAVGSTPTSFPGAGTAAFGLNLRANTSPSITNSADKAGSGTGTVASNYNTVNQFAFVPSTATAVASVGGPSVDNIYTVSYAAQAGSTTKPGAFSTVFNYVCTGTF